ncbi:16S rRNA (cytidine(1402)-2'-O)-methyltransferase [hydrothermal vent metagenome]|uniref:16S rRNA (Cytidine(1402)-2'-O)-methyltransferase n=1 Tax=hydrothermal vent metagenome TaxID=652676 RepID=A0A3B0ZJ27_9ZZZZ
MSNREGILYIVATPIGNMGDITERALQTLREVELIAAEDTRHSARLLNHHGIKSHCIALHEHNERNASAGLIKRLEQGDSIALISDAGTPLISDPGFYLVREVQQAGYRVVPIPGASALIAALSVAGLPSDRFSFEGFLPSKREARRRTLEKLNRETRTLIFYESTHRIFDSLHDMVDLFGAQRQAAVVRELTKTFETVHRAELSELCEWMAADDNQRRGEFVVLVHGAEPSQSLERVEIDPQALLIELMALQPPKKAAAIVAKLTGLKKNALYELGLRLKSEE